MEDIENIFEELWVVLNKIYSIKNQSTNLE